MRSVSFAIFTGILIVWSHSGAADDPGSSTSTPYQPECDSFAQAIQTIKESLAPVEALGIVASVNCTQDADCTGFGCVLTIDSNSVKLRVKLHPCEDPPQMGLLVQDPGSPTPYIEESISHGDTFDIPGLQINYLGFVTLDVAIGVEFEKVQGGFQIGLDLVFEGDLLSPAPIPLLPPTVIQTPDCPTTSPGPDLQCIKMEELVDSLRPPYGFTCSKHDDCKGFSCSGTVVLSGNPFPIKASAVLDSCSDPISYTLYLFNPANEPYWNHQFVHSENVPIEGSSVTIPQGVTASLNVTLEPYTMDIDYLITTIELIVCIGQQCMTDVFIDRGLVPIPPCDRPMTSSPTPRVSTSPTPLTGAPDECSSMQAIANDIMSNALFANDAVTCNRSRQCDGFSCNMFTNNHNYILSVKLFHCEDPVRLLFRLDGTDEGSNVHIVDNVTQDDEVSIGSFVPQGKVKFFLMRRSSVSIEVAVSIELGGPSGTVITVPLIEDRIITVPPCPTGLPVVTVPSSKPPVTKPTSISTSTPASQTKPGDKTKKPNKPNNNGTNDKNTDSKPGGSGARIGLGIGIPLLAIVVIVAVMYLWFRQRSRIPSDNLNLIENSSAPI